MITLTDLDIQAISERVIAQLKESSVTIDELSTTNALAADDMLELNKGRKVSLDDLRKFIRGFGIFLEIIAKDDKTTIPSDNNVFSALRTLSEINKSTEELKNIFLRKDQEDKTDFLLRLLGGLVTTDIKSDDFLLGALGTGYGLLKKDSTGKSYFEVDKLFVRLKAIFAELEVMELTYSGGNFIFGPAGARCIKVEEYDEYYRCYFTADDGSKKVKNKFRVDDQVQCRESNIEEGVHENVSNKYYWRLCVGVGDDYIDLSKSVRDMASDDPPAEGDSMVTVGNQKDVSRQNVIIISVYGEGSPSITRYQGINSFSMEGKAIKTEYYDATTGRYKEITYGDNYNGAPDRTSFFEYIDGEGLKVRGAVDVQPGSVGWKNFTGLSDSIQVAVDAAGNALDKANQAQTDAEDAKQDAEDAKQDAADAAGRLEEWASDSVISPTEKLALKQELANLQSEYDTNIANAGKYGLSTTAYTNAWNAYKTELEYHSADTPENITIRPAFKTSQATFYTERETLLTAIAAAAKEYADKLLDSLAVGTENLLLNTGFTGNYKVTTLSAATKLSADTSLYSDKLEHWTGTGSVVADTNSMSGYACQIGSLAQNVVLISGESYVVSYKAKGTSASVSCGGYTGADSLTSAYKTYTHKFTYQGGGIFMISGNATVCEIKLERGTVRTDWCPSRKDSSPVADEFKHFWYLQDALQGNTQILGGLTLTSMIQLGKWADGVLKQVNAGISGIYNNDQDVAFWAGGTFSDAIKTVQKVITGDYPTETEWRSLAKFVATHGGDLIIRGYIYAVGGIFNGRVNLAEGSTGWENLEGLDEKFKGIEDDLKNMKDDGLISPAEKTALKSQMADVKSEYSQIIANAKRYKVDTSAYTTAYNSAIAAFTKYTKATPEYITIEDDFNNISAYYTARQTILDLIEKAYQTYLNTTFADSKNELAKYMGYSNYEDLVAMAEKGDTIIKGGHINTKLIEADAIVTAALLADIILANGLNLNNNTVIDRFGNMTIKGTIRNPFVTLTYKRIYSSASGDVWGFDGSGVSNDNVIIGYDIISAELLIAWGAEANGRRMIIVNKSDNTDHYIKVKSGYAIIINGTYQESRVDLPAGSITDMVCMGDYWTVMNMLTTQPI